ncbi:MAG: SGNH/GDSL hydrolase family protein [Gordonia sp. (in: high G+C Gram-positive bacteria)]
MTDFRCPQHPRPRCRSAARRFAVGLLGAGTAISLIGAGPAVAAPLDDLNGLLGGLSNTSSELGLPDLLPALPTLPGLPLPNTTTGTTRCTSVVQVGDSTSVIADDAGALPTAADTAGAQYRRVGVTTVTVDALSGRAIVGGPGTDAEHAVASRLAAGGPGCWVIAMGVNDAGSIAGGSSVGADERIDRILGKLGGQPVLWPTIASSNPANTAFGAASMGVFNSALRRAISRYPNLAVYDWAGRARAEMFAGDGIHYTAAATAERNRRFADALATAFPPGVGAVPATRWVAG